MTTTDRVGGLRALLQNPPSDELWEALCDELALWDAEAREQVALPYVLEHLARWPVEITRWTAGGEPAWQQRLANAWTVRGAEEVRALVARDGARWLTALDVRDAASAEALAPLAEQLSCLTHVEVSTDDGRALAALVATRWPKSLRVLKPEMHWDAMRRWSRQVVEALAQNETLAGLESLELWGVSLSAPAAQALASSPHLRALRTLRLNYSSLEPAGARALADSPVLDTVERLDLSHNPRLGLGLAALVGSPRTRALRALHIKELEISATCARALARATWPPLLEELELDLLKLEPPALAELAGATGLRALRALRLRVGPDATGAARLLGSPHLSGLRELNVAGELEGVWEVMCRNPALAAVERLDITCAGLEAAQLEQLADSPMRPGLQALWMMCAQEVDVAVLGERAQWPALRALGLWGQRRYSEPRRLPMLSDAGVERLAQSGLLAGLDSLDLDGNALGDAAVWALARSGHLSQLRRLELAENQIGDAGVTALLRRAELDKIEELGLARNQIGDVGAATLARSPLLRALKPHSMGHVPDGGLLDNKIGLAGTLALLRSPYLDPERSLELAGNALTHEDIVALAGEPAIGRLRGLLWVSAEDEREETWQALIDSPHANQRTRKHAISSLEELRDRLRRER